MWVFLAVNFYFTIHKNRIFSPRVKYNMWDIIPVDISGRHRIKGGYYMVCAAAALTVSADHIEKVKQITRSCPSGSKGLPVYWTLYSWLKIRLTSFLSRARLWQKKGTCTINLYGCQKVCFPGLSNIRNPLQREGRSSLFTIFL